jgi:NAD(P)H dehydrogenase (quinone)
MTVLGITGSTGQVGGRVTAALAQRGVEPRLIVRDASRAPAVPGGEVRVATYLDEEAARAALEGVDVLLMVSAEEAPDRREQHRSFIRAAADAGVGHIVYTSFAGAAPDATFTLGRDHFDAEQAIRESGMRHTILRDNFYSDLLPFFADEEGVIRGPAGDGRVAAVARADVADVAVAALVAPSEHEAVYELTGPEAITLSELAERASAVLGRTLTFRNETVEEAYESRRRTYDVGQWQLDAWVSTYTAIADESVSRVTDDVERVTGHPARTVEDALRGVGG